MKVLIVGAITRDTNVFAGVAHHSFGGTALYAARTYARFDVDVRLVTRLTPADAHLIAAELPNAELITQPSPVTTAFENSYGAGDVRTQRVTAIAPPIEFRQDYLRDVDWLHLGPLHPQDLHAQWLQTPSPVPIALDLQGFARQLQGERIVANLDARIIELLPRIEWLKASRVEWRTLQAYLHIGPLERPARGAIETLVTDGADGGSVLRSGQRDVRWTAAPPVTDCDPTGAGDVFLAAYLYHRASRRASAHRAAAEAARLTSELLLRRREQASPG
jgi:sugar/nucleoside kinase (ribokinase family)